MPAAPVPQPGAKVILNLTNAKITVVLKGCDENAKALTAELPPTKLDHQDLNKGGFEINYGSKLGSIKIQGRGGLELTLFDGDGTNPNEADLNSHRFITITSPVTEGNVRFSDFV